MIKILFVCKDNAVHSQIAECICHFLGNRVCQCSSAGLEKGEMNQDVVALINQIYQIDIANSQYPKKINELTEFYDLAIAINCDLDLDAGYIERWNLDEQLSENLIYQIEEKIIFLLHEIKLGEIR